jgi:ABC-type antimicrobial peptide transport system permease subunit
MLGIIIGVVTVSLLTTVAQGVSDAVISSIRSQSTLSIVMNTSSKMTYQSLSSILKAEQPEKSADDYYDYSLIYSSNGVIANDLSTFDAENESVSDYLVYERLYTYTQEELDKMSDTEKQFAYIQMTKKKARPVGASIYAVDANFSEVYDLELSGRFPKEDNEILVDEDFLKAYLDGISSDSAIGQTVSIGIKYYTQIVLKFNQTPSDDVIKEITNYIQSVDNEWNKTSNGLSLTIIENDDGTMFSYDAVLGTLTINVEFSSSYTNQAILQMLSGSYYGASYVAPSFAENLDETNSSVSDVYDISNSKIFTIVGVLKDGSSPMASMTSSSSENSLTSFMLSSRKGTCYMLLDDSNLSALGESKSSVNSVVISYAYLRYKTEDVMSDSTTNLTVAMISSGYGYMSDFMIVSMSSVAKIISRVMSILTTMLTVISVISLIVGGIGIMNIMLVAVTERTREIGIRKAIGAKRSSILVQFLIEALMLSILGGLIGLGISAIGVVIISNVMSVSMSIPLWVIGMSLGFCTAIGLIFGMFPAIKASKMQPIDALRRE